MKRTLTIARYLLFLGLVMVVGIWFCKSEKCTPIHEYLFQYAFFQIFKGNREFYINLLVGFCTSAIFASIGFYIDYFEKKRDRKEELFHLYLTVRNRCFERLFYEQNSYDKDSTEVAEIVDFFCRYINLVLDYRASFSPIKIVMLRLFSNLRRKLSLPQKTYTQHSNDGLAVKYIFDDKYALICNLFADLNLYFTYIYINQTTISEQKRIVDICEKQLTQFDESNGNPYKVYLDMSKKYISAFEKRLESRFPYNTKRHQSFPNKRDLFSKFYAIDLQFNEKFYRDYTAAFIMQEECIVEDSGVLYDVSDESIKLTI